MEATRKQYQGFDQAIPVTKEQAQVMSSNGKTFVGRYINGTWKKMDKAEAQMLTANGLDIFSIYQTTAQMSLGNDGETHGAAALKLARDLGQPEGSTIFFAVDFDTDKSHYAAIETFFRAIRKGLAGEYQVGIYGEFEICMVMKSKGAADATFQTYAWSGGKVLAGNNVMQYSNDVLFKGYTVDLCEADNLAAMWNYRKSVPVPRPPFNSAPVPSTPSNPLWRQNAFMDMVTMLELDKNFWKPETIITADLLGAILGKYSIAILAQMEAIKNAEHSS